MAIVCATRQAFRATAVGAGCEHAIASPKSFREADAAVLRLTNAVFEDPHARVGTHEIIVRRPVLISAVMRHSWQNAHRLKRRAQPRVIVAFWCRIIPTRDALCPLYQL